MNPSKLKLLLLVSLLAITFILAEKSLGDSSDQYGDYPTPVPSDQCQSYDALLCQADLIDYAYLVSCTTGVGCTTRRIIVGITPGLCNTVNIPCGGTPPPVPTPVYVDVSTPTPTPTAPPATPTPTPIPPTPTPTPINTAPTASAVSTTQPNYCTSGPSATISWTYADPDGDSQGSYQVQIATDPAFTSVVNDSGRVTSTSKSYSTGQGVLSFNATYYSRVKVWDSAGISSAWTQ